MFSSNNWPRACALAIVMIVCVVMPLAWYNQRVVRKSELELRT
jgi:putrescine transport system permease protein